MTYHGDSTPKLLFKRLKDTALIPTRSHATDAGLDLYAPETQTGVTTLVVDTGIAFDIPPGWVGLVTARSSQNMAGVLVSLGVIDAGYTGPIKVVLRNLRGDAIRCIQGERIAQMILLPIAAPIVQEVDELPSSIRSARGFGSTGK